MKPILFPDPIRTKEDYEAIKNQLIVPYSVLIENTLERISVGLKDEVLFYDSEMKRICIEHFGTTYADLWKTQTLDGAFKESNITNALDFRHFRCLRKVEDEAFSYCVNLKNIILPINCEAVNSMAFFNCHSLEEIDFPSTVKQLGESAFSDCYGLETISLPFELESIGQYCFCRCSNLKELYVNTKVIPHVDDGTFITRCHNLESIYVKEDMVKQFMTKRGWSMYSKLIKPFQFY